MKSTWVVTLFLASWALVSAYGRAASGTDAEVQSVADIGAELIAGNYEKAAADAQKFLRTAEDEDAATEARRILAVSLRKQGKWREAAGAYQALSRQFPKGSDDRLRYAATSDVLLASPKGVYKGTDEKQKLSDDAALKAALAKWATFRCTRLSSYCQRLGRARSPQDVVRIILPAAEEARGIFLVGPDTPPDEAHRVAKTAGQKLELIKKRVCAGKPWRRSWAGRSGARPPPSAPKAAHARTTTGNWRPSTSSRSTRRLSGTRGNPHGRPAGARVRCAAGGAVRDGRVGPAGMTGGRGARHSRRAAVRWSSR